MVALGNFHYRLERSGREYESDFALHLAVEQGRVQRYQMYEDSWAVAMIAAMDLASYRAQAAAAFEFDVRSRLHEIRVPTHVVHGENDRSLPRILGEAIHEGIADSKLHLIEGAGHFPNLEASEDFNALIASILAG